MRIILDIQGIQNHYRYNDLGQHVKEFAKACIRNFSQHEFFLFLNNQFPETIKLIRAEFSNLLPQENIFVWSPPELTNSKNWFYRKLVNFAPSEKLSQISELLRESFLLNLNPDIILICSLFDPESIISINRYYTTIPTSVMLYDFIPYDDKKTLLKNKKAKRWYISQLDKLKHANLIICISKSIREQGIKFGLDPEKIINVSNQANEVLNNESFRQEPIPYGLLEAKKYSWDAIAKKSISAFENLNSQIQKRNPLKENKQNLAFICSLNPNNKFFIFYSELLTKLSIFYNIHIINNNKIKSLPDHLKNIKQQSPAWLIKHKSLFTRKIYFLEDTLEHKFILPLLQKVSGTLVLHDFFLGHLRINVPSPFLPFEDELYRDYGYKALMNINHLDQQSIINEYPLNSDIIDCANGIIIHSNYTYDLAKKYFNKEFIKKWRVIPACFTEKGITQQTEIKEITKITRSEINVCYLGQLNDTSKIDILLDAWETSNLGTLNNSNLIFISEIALEEKKYLLNRIKTKNLKNIKIQDYLKLEDYTQHLKYCDMAIIFQNNVKKEFSISMDIFNCIQNKIPLLINNNQFFNEFNLDLVNIIPTNFDKQELEYALNKFWKNINHKKNIRLSDAPNFTIQNKYELMANKYLEAIEFFSKNNNHYKMLFQNISSILKNHHINNIDLLKISKSIVTNTLPKIRKKQLFIDISVFLMGNNKTGIHRVVSFILKESIESHAEDFKIEPVYINKDEPHYRYARKFSKEFFSCKNARLENDFISVFPGDILLNLDLNLDLVSYKDHLDSIKDKGVLIYTCVYDLLPLLTPNNFLPHFERLFKEWFKIVSEYDGLICISKSVALEVMNQLKLEKIKRITPLKIGYFHLGSEMDSNYNNFSIERNHIIIRHILNKTTFLMVSTIEPRKGYLQTIQAFELLWQKNIKINLVIAGQKGWMVEKLIEKIENHPELNKQLFWIEKCDDVFLKKLYQISSCLIYSSEAEGFGLPIIEAAQYKLPLLIRNIPVFKEIAGEHATYFSGMTDLDLSIKIEEWLIQYQQNAHPKSENIHFLSWKQSTSQLLNTIINNQWSFEYSSCSAPLKNRTT